MNKMTVIPSDGFVSIDGVGKAPLVFSAPEDVHAFQWYGEFGVVEYKEYFDGERIVKPENKTVTSYEDYQSAIEAWQNYVPPEPPVVENLEGVV